MKNLFKILLLVATIVTSSQMLAERSCNARDNSCSWGRKDRETDHSRDGIASTAIRPADWVLGDANIVRTVTTPAREPVDAVLPPWRRS